MSSDFRISGSSALPLQFISAGVMEDLYTDTPAKENLPFASTTVDSEDLFTKRCETYYNSSPLQLKINRVVAHALNSLSLPLKFIPKGMRDFSGSGNAENDYQHGIRCFRDALKYDDAWLRKMAFMRFQSAAFDGHAGAACELGKHYLHGWVVDQSTEEAQKCFLNAANKQNAEACYILGVLSEQKLGKSSPEAFRYLKIAAELGNVNALVRIGEIYDFGNLSHVKGSDFKAFICYLNAARMGNRNAQFKTAEMLETGRGCRKSESDAQAWYKKAAEGKEKALASKAAEDNQGLF